MEMPTYNFAISPALNLINALIHIKEHGPWKPQRGICGNILQWQVEWSSFEQEHWPIINEIDAKLDKAMFDWPKKSHDRAYPVGGYDELKIEEKNGTVWQNPRRLELLDFIIDYLNTKG